MFIHGQEVPVSTEIVLKKVFKILTFSTLRNLPMSMATPLVIHKQSFRVKTQYHTSKNPRSWLSFCQGLHWVEQHHIKDLDCYQIRIQPAS